jgi:hypothetical protein
VDGWLTGQNPGGKEKAALAPAPYTHFLRSAGFQTCCGADFQVGGTALRAAGLETCGTAGLETCATKQRTRALNESKIFVSHAKSEALPVLPRRPRRFGQPSPP